MARVGNKTEFVVVGTYRQRQKTACRVERWEEGRWEGLECCVGSQHLYSRQPRACPGRLWSRGGLWGDFGPVQTGVMWPKSARSAGTGSKDRFEWQDQRSGVEGDRGLPDSQPFPGDP